jgi:hypothetical protein
VPRKRKYNSSTGRKYGPGSYDYKYGKRTSKQRSNRNKARRAVFNRLAEKYGKTKAAQMLKGKDISHIRSISKGGTNAKGNLKISSVKKNRGRANEGNRKRGKRN